MRKTVLLISVILSVFISACGPYAITFNDNLVYQPEQLFSDYIIADSALSHCVGEAIKETRITQAMQLRELRCPHAGIASLDGLKLFTDIVVLDLSFNVVVNVEELHKLSRLKHINLFGNQQLDCKKTTLLGVDNDQLILPQHCLN